MKKIVSISLVCLFALYHVGYYFIYEALKHQNNLEWQSKFLQDDFDNSQLQTAAIPISFPYQLNQDEYQTVDESIEIDGIYYRIIKKRYANDTLHIVYVNDHSSKKIESDYHHWAKQLAQNNSQSSTKENHISIRILDHQYIRFEYSFTPLNYLTDSNSYSDLYLSNSPHIYLQIPSPPPKFDFS